MTSYVYETTNLVNGKTYTGSTCKNLLGSSSYCGSGKQLLSAIAKYGKENFSRKILAICPDREFAYVIEDQIVGNAWTASTNYNLQKVLLQDGETRPCSEERKRKIGFANSGKKNGFYGKEHTKESKKKMSFKGKKNPMFGKKRTAEEKLAISKKLKEYYANRR